MKELDKEAIEGVFKKMDEFLTQKGLSEHFLVMGGAIVIYLGMPDRSTADIDFYGNKEDLKNVLQDMASCIGLPFNPETYEEMQEPYLQWMKGDFIHMPVLDEWKDDLEVAWEGRSLKVVRPPLGVIIGSKLAAAREKDIADVKYLSDNFSDWKVSLEKYLPMFSNKDQEDIQDNLVFLEMYLMAQDPETNVSIQEPKIPSHKIKS